MRHTTILAFAALNCTLAASPLLAGDPGTRPALPAKIMAEISADRIKADIEKLAAFGTRHTSSDQRNPIKGIGAASNWLMQQFQAANTPPDGAPALGPRAARMIKATQENWAEPASDVLPDETQFVNHIGFIRGKRSESELFFYYVVAHYDSRNAELLDWAGDAPGANDNASGVAAVLEIARALADEQLDATVVFLLTSGGEQGSLGAKFHIENVLKLGYRVMGVLNLEMIGDPSSAAPTGAEPPEWRVRVLSPGLDTSGGRAKRDERAALGLQNDSSSRQLARFVDFVSRCDPSAMKPVLVSAEDPAAVGGDDRVFSGAGFPAITLTQASINPARRHRPAAEEAGVKTGDVPEFVDAKYAADVARLAAATIVHLCNAPMAPKNARLVTGAPGAAKLAWEKNPESDVAGYELVWREKNGSDWTGLSDAGPATEMAAPKDPAAFHFGVRAYDNEGYRGPVSFVMPPSE